MKRSKGTPPNDYRQLQTVVPQEDYEKLEMLIKKFHSDRSKIVRAAVQFYLEHHAA